MNQDPVETGPYDVIIAGVGAAGCVLASRLSEISGKQVLSIEAGPDAPPGREHPDIRNPYPVSYGNDRFFWPGLTAEMRADSANGGSRVSEPFLQGFGVGGGSNVNGMAADRAQPSDYDEWRDLGASGWGWREVLPYFKKLEHDQDFAGTLHGREGPMPVRRVRAEHWAPLAKALGNAFSRRGSPLIADSNADFRDGVSPVSMTCLPDRRVSASMAYLTKQVRQRRNLTILTGAKVERVNISNGQVRGVDVLTSTGVRTFSAPEVIVACGAVHSPTLLLRSGIGSAQELRRLGIDVICDLPGVGHNLQNHPMVPLAMHLQSSGMQPVDQRAWQQNQLRYSSKVAGCPAHDMLFLISNKSGWHPLGRHIGGLGVFVLKAFSKGSVELMSPDPAVAPRVRFNLLEDGRDRARMLEGLRIALEVLDDDEIMRFRNEVFLPDSAIVARLSRRSTGNWLLAWAMSMALRIVPLRRALLGGRALDVRSMAKNEVALCDYIRAYAQAVYHPCGTCRMGSSNDPGSVVDPSCRVLGMSGLRVVDASIFPTIPRGQTHFPVLMAAEKMADVIKATWRNAA